MYPDTEPIEGAFKGEVQLELGCHWTNPLTSHFVEFPPQANLEGTFEKFRTFYFPQHVAPRSTLTVSHRMNLRVSQVHEFSLMHRLNYSATKSYTVNVNYSSSNNR